MCKQSHCVDGAQLISMEVSQLRHLNPFAASKKVSLLQLLIRRRAHDTVSKCNSQIGVGSFDGIELHLWRREFFSGSGSDAQQSKCNGKTFSKRFYFDFPLENLRLLSGFVLASCSQQTSTPPSAWRENKERIKQSSKFFNATICMHHNELWTEHTKGAWVWEENLISFRKEWIKRSFPTTSSSSCDNIQTQKRSQIFHK